MNILVALNRVALMLCRTVVPAALALFVTFIAPIGASAASITRTLSVDINPAVTLTGGNDLFPSSSFNEFDSSLGTLNSISYTLSGDVEWTGSAQNPFPLVSGGFLFAGTNELLGATLVFCPAYGLCDVSSSATDTFAPDFPFVTGTGSTFFNLELIGNTGEQVTTVHDGDHPLTGSVTYNYTPNAVPEPLTLSLFGAGLAGAVAMRRRKKNVA